jgi:hypothetical protein
MTVRITPSTRIARPTIAGSAAYRLRHTASPSSTTGVADGIASVANGRRPIAGVTRRMPNASGEICAPFTRSGRDSGPARFIAVARTPAIASKLVWSAVQATRSRGVAGIGSEIPG